jgi:hypothetical protein
MKTSVEMSVERRVADGSERVADAGEKQVDAGESG